MAEVVRCAGGWLFDRVMAGWDVTVLSTDDADDRPLQILGARAADLEMVLTRQVRGSCLRGIAVQSDLYGSDARVRRMVHEAQESLAEVRFWGPASDGLEWPDGDGGSTVCHQLSLAARAFKAQALAAAGAIPAPHAQHTELFRTPVRYPTLATAL
jgi:hypothetical protein